MNLRPPFVTFLLSFGTALLALVAALAIERTTGSGIVGSLVAAAIVAGLFALRPVDGLLAFGVAVLLVDTVEAWAGGSVRLLDEAAIPALAVVAVVAHRDRLRIPRPGLREAGLALFFASALLSTVLGSVPLAVWAPALLLLAKGFAFFYLVVSLRFDTAAVRNLMVSVLGLGLAITVVGLVEFLAPALVRGAFLLPPIDLQRGDLTIVTSVFRHPALYGWLTAFLSLFLYARFAVDRAPWALPLALLANAGTLLSGRRTPLLGVLAGLVTGAARQLRVDRGSARAWVAVGGAVLVVGVVMLPFLSIQVRDTLSDYVAPPAMIEEILGPDPDAQVLERMQPRVGLYLGSVAIARDELPFGAGLGRFGSHMSREQYSPVYAEYGMDRMYGISERLPIAVTDAFWPMILGETGALGLLGALVFFGILGRDAWRAAATPGSVAVRVLLLGGLMIYVEALVRSLTSSVFVAPPIEYWVFGTLGMALSLARDASTDPAPPADAT